MKLKELIRHLPDCKVFGSQEIDITGICTNSKEVSCGDLFIARKGLKHDGKEFIFEAICKGAKAVVANQYDPSINGIAQVIAPITPSTESELADLFYGHPSEKLLTIAITGTNGKTTMSFILKHILDSCMGQCGLIGTIEYNTGRMRKKATRTTPDVVANHKMLQEMIEAGCSSVVMEVTSHALDQGRVDKIDFDIAVFSNLTLEHLDYHRTMENYGTAKKILFDRLGREKGIKERRKWAVVNLDSNWSEYMLRNCMADVISYGIEQAADLRAEEIEFLASGTRVVLSYQEKNLTCFFPFVGRFNVYNCLGAMAAALSQGIPLEKIAESLLSVPPIPGRLQPVFNVLNLKIYVDFAHKPEALLNALMTLNEIKEKQGKLFVVFGCGGDRDRLKRPKMAQACERYADKAIVTNDNPRTEDPMQICEEIVKGFSRPGFFHIELDRRRAIKKAIESATLDDIILIAGKGHETEQIFEHQIISFDDCKIAEEICAEIF